MSLCEGSLRRPQRIAPFQKTQDELRQKMQGAPLLVLEAMKMEHTLTAPHDGEVSQFQLSAGDLVEEGAVLMVVTPPSDVPASP